MTARIAGGSVAVLLLLASAACLPRNNPFDRADIEDAYQVRVRAVNGTLEVHFSPLQGTGLQGYRVYREDSAGERTLVGELPHDQQALVDANAPAASELAEERLGDATLWWRVAGYTGGGEGPLSRRDDRASTKVLPDTRIEPAIPEYISGQSAVAVLVEVTPSPLDGAPAATLFQYRFRGGEWTDPIVAGPLVLTGLADGRYTLEVAAVDENGDADLTPARATFIYDFNVPEGTLCDPAVCNQGLICALEPVGSFCRRLCDPLQVDACPSGLTCRLGSGQNGMGACVVVAAATERCEDRLCEDGLACADTGDGRGLCGTPCGAGNPSCGGVQVCAPALSPVATDPPACVTMVGLDEVCVQAACSTNLACEEGETDPRCRHLCETTINCGGGQTCTDLGRADLRICR